DNEEFNEIMQLRQWAMTSNIPHTKLDSLLQILRKRLLPNLPANAKTFLKTNSAEHNIKQFYDDNGCSVYKPFSIAVYAGREKPNDLSAYFENFIVEINELLLNGIIIDEKSFKVCIMYFACDRPARSFIKCIKGHVGSICSKDFYACERYEVRGTRHENRTIYYNDVCKERTDQSFRDQKNLEHYIGLSPSTFINSRIDTVRQFVLDFMHLCCLGIMKKMLVECWLKGNLSTKLNQNSKMRLSQQLMQLKSQIPADFQRSTRSIESHFAEEKKTTLPLLVNILKKQYDKLNDRVIVKKLIYKIALLFSKSLDNTVFLNNDKILMIDDIDYVYTENSIRVGL
ncbi:hypothetical protein ALC57_01997, partial [Trachymyrmex cornetzi]